MKSNEEIMADFRLALNRMLKTQDGETVIKALNLMYVDSSCVADTPEMTYYKLGQKEFVQSLAKEIDRDIIANREGE